MQSLVGNCWCEIFLDAFRYSTNYLLFTITVVISSLICLWIYEKPQFYKFIFKRSKHSILSPIPSEGVIEGTESQSMVRTSNTTTEKRLETAKEEFGFEMGHLVGEMCRPVK